MTTLYLLKQNGWGAIAYNQDLNEILKKYEEKIEGGKYIGTYHIDKVEATAAYDKMSPVNGWEYLNSLECERLK